MAQHDIHKEILGRGELIDLVDFGLTNVPAKVDTGAFRSAVHADEIKLSDDGTTLSFRVLASHPTSEGRGAVITTRKFTKVWVSSSFGHREERYDVKLKVRIGTKTFTTNFSLANRTKKTFPILLGRKTLTNRFLVDTVQSQIDPSDLREKYKLDFFMD